MESLMLPSTTLTTPTKSRDKLEKSKIISRNGPPKLTGDDYLKRLCKLGRLTEAISYLETCSSRVRHSTLSHLIESCIHANSLELCSKLHARVRNLVKSPGLYLETKLLSMYAKCGSLVDAFAMFDEMPEKDLLAWSAMIGACSREKKWNHVVELFYRMMADSVVPDDFLLPKILQACGNSGDVETGSLIHGIAIKSGMLRGIRVSNAILAVYAKCQWLNSAEKFFKGMQVIDRVSWNSMISGYCHKGKIEDARRLFDSMRQEGLEPDVITWNVLISGCNQFGKCDIAMSLLNEMKSSTVKPDVYTWSSMIAGFAQNNRRLEALKLFEEMLSTGVEPNEVALMSAVSVCSSLKDIGKGKEVHSVAMKLGYGEDTLAANSLVDMYSKCESLESARQVFDSIPSKDVYTWNSMISGYYQAGYCSVAHELFKRMQEAEILPNVITLNVMITGYMQNEEEDQAMDLFRNMEKKWDVKPDTASWNALIAGYVYHGEKTKAFGIFRQMQSAGVKANSVTILSILPACANLIATKKVREIHCYVLRRNLESELSTSNALIDAYAKSGNLPFSATIFGGMSHTDIITWNTMLSAYVLHGRSLEAIDIFDRMGKLGFRSIRSTFASMISAYGAAKMVDEGIDFFNNMTSMSQIVPCLDHYVAMVNLYGYSGKVDEAFEFIRGMSVQPNVSIWSAFLTACCRHKHVTLAIHAAENLLQLEPDSIPIQRLLSKLYDSCGIPVKKKRGITRAIVKKRIGKSWIEHKNVVYTFISGDIQQMGVESVSSWIKSMEAKDKGLKIKETISIEEEEAKATGGVHSEKLALGFVLNQSSRPVGSIRIVKNLRMCDHCHRFAKLVSKNSGCEVYISDSARLHHFKDGICSCGDFW
ncbi:pentatricopeptide repeat-containing protein At1g19720 [Andrographis paniculata]|uniref:pentatricopeptide repeat-containing protein At1g19720 n=1 Tax=Andrographis paniculata TaxID=175694 RepID=UPI0021E8CF6B|nr:pentatricopeptide repeat-containing protein At1g19720 [Andrographis paniculata]XP_051124429.1 pentatricopeptide repeat-containing protein At1g19720 [Andrographis paniculata]XP_051124430.1 pentatricopeptide repeat-containing protein At1g19720 [Andrographis paniculata]